MITAIWWIRRDVRLQDNQALHKAHIEAEWVIPLFILDANLLSSPYYSPKRMAFLLGALLDLDEQLQAIGSRLIVRQGKPQVVLAQLVAETGATLIVAERDVSPYARRRDEAVAGNLPLILSEGLTMRPPESVVKRDGSPYVVYTPYSRTWKMVLMDLSGKEILPAPAQLKTPFSIEGDMLPTEPALPASVPFTPTATEARKRLKRFTQGHEPPVFAYKEQRDMVGMAGTSQLSPYLRFGMISARQAVVAVHEAWERAETLTAIRGTDTWMNELIWREFYIMILYHFPQVHHQSFQPAYAGIEWRNDEDEFGRWCEGRTGYPLVDAGMRQLNKTGWMHNRARMVVAAFLVKDLLIDWRWGEKYFMQKLVDGDIAANNGGWQWSAGTGTDAAPYFRIFNPTTQAKNFDPQGDYIRRWIPELRDVPLKFIHEPSKMSEAIQKQVGCRLGKEYPLPIVNHKEARKRALEVYAKAREQFKQETKD